MNSSRLPGKVLMPLPLGSGKPIIQWIVDELKKSSLKTSIIVASSVSSDNSVLEQYCKRNYINIYRGDEEDVLSRFIDIVKQAKPDVVVRLTGDNPIVDILLLEKAISYHVKNKCDYTKTQNLPIGMNMEILSPSALLKIENIETTKSEKEHVTPYFQNSQHFKMEIINLIKDDRFAKLRLTVDYISDFLVLSQLLNLSQATNLYGVSLVEHAFEKYPWVFEGNTKNLQKKIPSNLTEELHIAISVLEEIELFNAARILGNGFDNSLSSTDLKS